jgi:hypothetical protein
LTPDAGAQRPETLVLARLVERGLVDVGHAAKTMRP